MNMIDFQKTYQLKHSQKYIEKVLNTGRVDSGGKFTRLCIKWLKKRYNTDVYMSTSGTHALELALRALALKPGDEVLVPSYTFTSTANSILIAGATPVLVPVSERDFTVDADCLEQFIRPQTKAMIVVHYGGKSCDMDQIMGIAKKHKLKVVEDCAQAFLTECSYQGQTRYVGTIGDFGCFSFHFSKDVVAGEGGAIMVNNKDYLKFVSIYREKGTNREDFINGQVSNYQWISLGSSYIPSELIMALLLGQLELSDQIVQLKRESFQYYEARFKQAQLEKLVKMDYSKSDKYTNGHLYYVVFEALDLALSVTEQLGRRGIDARTHFIPLHSSKYGRQFAGDYEFRVERDLGKRLIRLPLYAGISQSDIDLVVDEVIEIVTRYHQERL